jgi:hypothetical protein
MRTDYIDSLTAWRIQRLIGHEPEAHRHPDCSAIRSKGVLLCDCGAIAHKWRALVGRRLAKVSTE